MPPPFACHQFCACPPTSFEAGSETADRCPQQESNLRTRLGTCHHRMHSNQFCAQLPSLFARRSEVGWSVPRQWASWQESNLLFIRHEKPAGVPAFSADGMPVEDMFETRSLCPRGPLSSATSRHRGSGGRGRNPGHRASSEAIVGTSRHQILPPCLSDVASSPTHRLDLSRAER